jgi:hydrogenase maturation factor
LEGSILVEGATGVTNKLLAADVDGILTFGDDEWCGGDMEWVDEGDGILVDCTCFNKVAMSRLFIIFRGNDLARFGAKCSNIASSFIMSIRFALFKSSPCSWREIKIIFTKKVLKSLIYHG